MEHPKEGRESEDSGNHDLHRVVEETGAVKSWQKGTMPHVSIGSHKIPEEKNCVLPIGNTLLLY